MQDKLKSLYEQMELELQYLNQEEKQVVKKYMMWAFERGEGNILNKIKNNKIHMIRS